MEPLASGEENNVFFTEEALLYHCYPLTKGGGTDSWSLDANCHLQIYSPLCSWIPKNSPLKSALNGEFSALHISYFTKFLV